MLLISETASVHLRLFTLCKMNKLFFGVLVSILFAYGSVEGWQRIGSKHYYIERSEEVTWYEALSKCQEMGGHLVNIKNQKEFDAIKLKLDDENDYWIDINDLTEEGVFISATTGREATISEWHQGEPNNGGDNDYHEDCVELWYVNDEYLMNDAYCLDKQFFICEYYD